MAGEVSITSNDGKTTAEVTKKRELKVYVGNADEVSAGGVSSEANTNLEGGKRTPSVVFVPSSTAGSTIDNVRSFSIFSVGIGNTIGGVTVPDGFSSSYQGSLSETIGSIAYTTSATGTLYITYLI